MADALPQVSRTLPVVRASDLEFPCCQKKKRIARYYAYSPSVLVYGSMLSLVLSGSMLVLLVPASAFMALAVKHWRFRIGSKA